MKIDAGQRHRQKNEKENRKNDLVPDRDFHPKAPFLKGFTITGIRHDDCSLAKGTGAKAIIIPIARTRVEQSGLFGLVTVRKSRKHKEDKNIGRTFAARASAVPLPSNKSK
ncbi:hypothetical protein [Cohnella rhizosphaerae]|uniref:Uncharacterized protein n=1 Tax=Cohnella rhizosphaerae TaxID=1457232 RepID=A0A9X4KY54_9BACL|nr:hypothetical protein [Cohnella rhizosphaerae]MDG0813471.1 hypothetical protein [Cohnella rhizosphaerae]